MNVATDGPLRCALAALPCALAAQQRDAVLKQINEPHPYYFREMYLPAGDHRSGQRDVEPRRQAK